MTSSCLIAPVFVTLIVTLPADTVGESGVMEYSVSVTLSDLPEPLFSLPDVFDDPSTVGVGAAADAAGVAVGDGSLAADGVVAPGTGRAATVLGAAAGAGGSAFAVVSFVSLKALLRLVEASSLRRSGP